MQTPEDFRFTTYQLLMAIDSTNATMMQMVAGSVMGGEQWAAASLAHQASYTALYLHLGVDEAALLMSGISPRH